MEDVRCDDDLHVPQVETVPLDDKPDALYDLSGKAFGNVDASGYAHCFTEYLERATVLFRSIKRLSYQLVDVTSGDKVLDVGSGLGDDIRKLAQSVHPNGCAIGIDASESLIAEARRRCADFVPTIHFVVGEAENLPWASDCFQACRADRVFQHLREPSRAMNEMVRVTTPNGRVVVADRDWGMVTIEASDVATTSAVLGRACAGIRNGWMGRNLSALFEQVGIQEVEVYRETINLNSFRIADLLLDLRIVVDHAVAEGLVAQYTASKWLDDLVERDANDRFSATITMFVVAGKKA